MKRYLGSVLIGKFLALAILLPLHAQILGGILSGSFPAGGASAAPVFTAAGTQCVQSGTCTMTISISSGHLIVAHAATPSGGYSTLSVTDSNGDSFSSCTQITESNSGRQGQLFYAIAGAAITTVTLTVNGYSSGNDTLDVLDYTNPASLATGTILDQCMPGAQNQNTQNWVTGTSSATTNATDLCAAFFFVNTGTWIVGTNYTERLSGQLGTADVYAEDRTTSVTATQQATATEQFSAYGPGVGACFK